MVTNALIRRVLIVDGRDYKLNIFVVENFHVPFYEHYNQPDIKTATIGPGRWALTFYKRNDFEVIPADKYL